MLNRPFYLVMLYIYVRSVFELSEWYNVLCLIVSGYGLIRDEQKRKQSSNDKWGDYVVVCASALTYHDTTSSCRVLSLFGRMKECYDILTLQTMLQIALGPLWSLVSLQKRVLVEDIKVSIRNGEGRRLDLIIFGTSCFYYMDRISTLSCTATSLCQEVLTKKL